MSLNVAAEVPPVAAPSVAESLSSTRPQVWFDGALHDIDSLQAGLTTHAMHYGSGVFEGIRSYASASGAAVFRLPWRWDGTPTTIASRAIDETGYVQPGFEALTAVRGLKSFYHNNAVVPWRIAADGEVANGYA